MPGLGGEQFVERAAFAILVALQPAGLGDQQPGWGESVPGTGDLFEQAPCSRTVAALHGGDAFPHQSIRILSRQHNQAISRAADAALPRLTTS